MEKQVTESPVKYLRSTIALKTELEKTFILLAERLANIYEKRIWKAEYGSWDEFLIDAKISMPMASKLISVYKKFVVEHKVPVSKLVAVRSWESLYSVRGLAINRDKALELVENGAVLSDKDMRKLANSQPECDEHDFYEIRICRNCGLREKLTPPS